MNKLNQIYNKLLNRNLNNNELAILNRQIQRNQFNLNQFVKNILNSKEFLLYCLQKIKDTFQKINCDVEKVDNTVIINYLNQLKKGVPFTTIENNIISNYKIHLQLKENKDLKINQNSFEYKMIKNVFQKVLKRTPTNEEYIKYNNYTENALENSLLHTIECSNLIDVHLNKLVEESITIDIQKK